MQKHAIWVRAKHLGDVLNPALLNIGKRRTYTTHTNETFFVVQFLTTQGKWVDVERFNTLDELMRTESVWDHVPLERKRVMRRTTSVIDVPTSHAEELALDALRNG